VQEALLADPALLLDQDAVHHRDLPRGAAEGQRRHPHRLGERDAMRGRGWRSCFVGHDGGTSLACAHHRRLLRK
jgi:hypothetical protein